MKLSSAVDLFLISVRADNLSKHTSTFYRQCLGRLVVFLNDPELASISVDHLRAFMADLRSQDIKYCNHKYRKPVAGGLSDYTLYAYATSIKRLFSWLEENEYIGPDQNPAIRLRKPKLSRSQTKDVKLDDLRALLNAARSAKPFPQRDYAIILFLIDTACRVGGLVGLRLGDLDLEKQQALVTEKGNKSRLVDFKEVTKAALIEWLAVRPAQTDYVFCSRRGGQLTGWGVDQLLSRLKESAGIKGRANPHSFRHAFAKLYLMDGGDLATLSDIMGHSDVMVTKQFYAVFARQDVKQKHDQHSPVSRLLDS